MELNLDFLPVDYKYCNECSKFTRHTLSGNLLHCVVCEQPKYDICDCDYCGFSFDEEVSTHDHINQVIIHGEGCHLSKDNELFWNFTSRYYWELSQIINNFPENLKFCSCHQETVFDIPVVLNTRTWEGHGMDCSNHIEWEVEMRCPICGNVNVYQDSNC